MPFSAGTRLGPYDILAPLGAGGMGEVYRARDTRLGREVAIKILPPEMAADPARRQRFEFEARVIAALNHPNIVAVYDVGEGYIVSELVDGESLRTVQFGLRKTLDIAVQIAEGLAAAHAAGVVHRDLKPGNILLARSGRVKILDFGIAKMTSARPAGPETETLTARTEPGLVLGTVPYMSPEQVRGQEVDYRSDIFSFGLILYQLLTGGRAFTGDTSVEIMTAILKQDAPELPDTIPAPIREIVAHCLEKNPANRFQSAKDLAFALAHIGTGASSRVTGVPAASRRRGLAGIAAAAVLLAGAAAGHYLWRASDPPQWTGTVLGGPEAALLPHTSPDGHLLAFEAVDNGLTQVAVMKPETGNWSILTHRRDRGLVLTISWSPDGALIYYNRVNDGAVYSVPVLGGDEHLVLSDAGEPVPLPDGSLLVARMNNAHRSQYFRFWPDTGRLVEVPLFAPQLASVISYSEARVLRGGRQAILFGTPIGSAPGRRPGLFTLDLAANTVRHAIDSAYRDESVRTFAAGAGGSILAAIPAEGLFRLIAIPRGGSYPGQTLFTTTSDVWGMDTGPEGSVYASLSDRPADIIRIAETGGPAERIASFARSSDLDLIMALPDGRWVVPVPVSGHVRLTVVEAGKEPAPLINTTEETASPMCPAGERNVAFVIGPEPRQTIAVAEIESGRIVQRIAPAKGEINSLTASPDGRTIYFAAAGAIWAVPSGGGEVARITAGDSAVMDAANHALVVQRIEPTVTRLVSVPLTGAAEREIPLDPALPLMPWPLSPSALDGKGRLLVSLLPRDSWFNPIAILDTATGRMTRVPADDLSDHLTAGWTADGRIVTIQVGLRATLWKFSPQSK